MFLSKKILKLTILSILVQHIKNEDMTCIEKCHVKVMHSDVDNENRSSQEEISSMKIREYWK